MPSFRVLKPVIGDMKGASMINVLGKPDNVKLYLTPNLNPFLHPSYKYQSSS